MNPLIEQLGGGFTLLVFLILFIWWVMLIILPFVVYSLRNEAKRHTLLLRGIIDELRANRIKRP